MNLLLLTAYSYHFRYENLLIPSNGVNRPEYTKCMTRSIRWLQEEIAQRMLQKMDIVKLQPRDILLLPDVPGKYAAQLAKRFPKSHFFRVAETSLSLFDRVRSLAFRGTESYIQPKGKIDPIESCLMEGLVPLPPNSVDLIFSSLFLHKAIDPKKVLVECRRVLRQEGLLVFSYLGPDTGRELRSLMNSQGAKSFPGAWDMHDLGDALVGEGFSDPVMDMEYLYLEYETTSKFLEDSEDLGLLDLSTCRNSISEIHPAIPKKLTLEIVYGHAWVLDKHLSRNKDKVAYFDIDQIKVKTNNDSI